MHFLLVSHSMSEAFMFILQQRNESVRSKFFLSMSNTTVSHQILPLFFFRHCRRHVRRKAGLWRQMGSIDWVELTQGPGPSHSFFNFVTDLQQISNRSKFHFSHHRTFTYPREHCTSYPQAAVVTPSRELSLSETSNYVGC